MILATFGCGYHRAGNTIDLPQNINTIAIPGFVSHSQTFRIEQLLTDAVVREFNARTQYHVVHDANADEDAVLGRPSYRPPPTRSFTIPPPDAPSAPWSP